MRREKCICNFHKCIFVREPNKHINCSHPLLLVTSLNILQLGWYVSLPIYCISQTSAVMMLTKTPFSKKFKPPFFQTSSSFLSQINGVRYSQTSLCFEWIFHQFFLSKFVVKRFVVVYLCIECWACLPIHGNKIVKQNILAFI